MLIVGLGVVIASLCFASVSHAETWGAISMSPDGTFSAVWNRYSSIIARDEAKADCERRSNLPEKCVAITASDSDWIAALWCKRQADGISSVYRGATILDALENAYNRAFADNFKREHCVLKVAIKADGTHAPKDGVTRVWGAISLSTDGKGQTLWQRSYRAVAEAEALSDCRAYSKDPTNCTTVSAYGSSWIIGVRCLQSDLVQVIVARGDTEAEALAEIYNAAKDRGYTPAQCKTVEKITANGSHMN